MTELFHDRARNLLVYKTADPQRIVQHVPGAQRINGSEFVAVPNKLHSLQICRFLGLPILAPMAAYDWPIALGRSPCAHQKTMANFMVAHPRSFNLSDPGTMKTLAALWAADFVMRDYESRGEKCHALVLAPLSILEDAWLNEINRNFLDRRTGSLVYGSAAQRLKRLQADADFYVINYDGLSVGTKVRPIRLGGVAAHIQNRADIKIIVIDEARNYHDSQTRRHRVARLAFGHRPFLWLLTGTPTSNGPLDAYGQARLVNGARGTSFTGWRDQTMMQISNFKWAPRKGAAEKVKEMLSPAVRFAIEDVWDGPPMVTETRSVELTAEQTKLLREIKNGFVMELKSGKTITAVNEAAVRTKMLQVCQGAVYDEHHNWHAVDALPRKNELMSIVQSGGSKILCFVPLTSVVRLVYSWLREGYKTGVINGATPPAERQAIIRSFQDDANGIRIIVADPGCLSLGVNLFAARTVIWYGATDKAEQYLQGCKRAHRPGQKFPVLVTRIVATPLEREIYRRIEANQALQGCVLEMVRAGKL